LSNNLFWTINFPGLSNNIPFKVLLNFIQLCVEKAAVLCYTLIGKSSSRLDYKSKNAILTLMRKIIGLRKKALTLVELMLVSSILLVAILALWQVYIASLGLVIQAKEKNIAVDDSRDVLEKIRCTAFAAITANFPNGADVPAATIGGFLLRDERIQVTYPNGINADPLQINIVITWTGQDKRAYGETFRTLRSRGL